MFPARQKPGFQKLLRVYSRRAMFLRPEMSETCRESDMHNMVRRAFGPLASLVDLDRNAYLVRALELLTTFLRKV